MDGFRSEMGRLFAELTEKGLVSGEITTEKQFYYKKQVAINGLIEVHAQARLYHFLQTQIMMLSLICFFNI